MSSFLERAKSVQQKVAGETRVTIHLDLLEGLIAEVELLTRLNERRHVESVAEITQRLQKPQGASQ